VTIPPTAPLHDAELGLDGEAALEDATLEALRDDGFLALSRLAAIGALEPF
jgi:hypothetical protein